MPASRTLPGKSVRPAPFLPTDFEMFTGVQVPDPITFVLSSKWLDRPQLYPRQATLLKVVFLREDLLTDYDRSVIAEWEQSFLRTGNNGITPGVIERMRYLRSQGYSHFREVLLVLGRRAGKGYVSALAMSYVLWRFMAKGDPQEFYGVDRDKRLACYIYAGKKEQARDNLWRDLTNVILGSNCYTKYVGKPLGESLSIFAPNDFLRIRKLEERGIKPAADMATFNIVPKESTVMSGRGPASFMLGFDEMAHVITAGGASRSAEEVYAAATPSLDQFKKDAFIIEPSSPWQMIGQFFQNWENSQEMDEFSGAPVYPEILMLQLASWEIYEDWEVAHEIPVFPDGFEGDLGEYRDAPHPTLAPLKGAIQVYDDAMKRLEKANPDTFAVERLSHWQATMDAYLDPKKIAALFAGWRGETLEMRTEGVLSIYYKGHADPSLANANFGIAFAHPETDDEGVAHCVFDYIGHWSPGDFPDSTIDYVQIQEEIWRLIKGFKPDEFTFDQWNSAAVIAQLRQRVHEAKFPKRVTVHEKTATAAHNLARAENFKVALNQGWIHAPHYELAELELRFLQFKNGKVEKQDAGPVQTKDVADCLMECAWSILGDQVNAFIGGMLSGSPRGALQGGFNPYSREMDQPEAVQKLSQLGRGRDSNIRGGGRNPARNPNSGRRRW